MLSRRQIAFSHVIYTSGFFSLMVVIALTAVVALTLRFAGEPQVLKVAVGPADGDNAKLIGAIARHLDWDGGRAPSNSGFASIIFCGSVIYDACVRARRRRQGRRDQPLNANIWNSTLDDGMTIEKTMRLSYPTSD